MKPLTPPVSTAFTLESPEGLAIRGDLIVPERPQGLVVIIHGFKGFKDWGFFPWLSSFLAERRLASCRFNMSRSGVGESSETFDRLDLFADDTYSIQLDDLKSVNDHLEKNPTLANLPRFLLGHSRGGAIALLGAATMNVSGVVTWSAIANLDRWDEQTVKEWRKRGHLDIVNSRTNQIMKLSTRVLDDLESNLVRLDISRAVESLQQPLLVVHGGSDQTVDASDAVTIAKWSPESSYLLIGGASHTMNAIHPLVTVPPALRMAAEASSRHMTQHCKVMERRRR